MEPEADVTRTEDLTSQIDGVRTDFVTAEAFEVGTLEVHLNGVRLQKGENFEELSTSSFRILEAPKLGDTLLVQTEVVGAGDTLLFPTVTASGIDPGRP